MIASETKTDIRTENHKASLTSKMSLREDVLSVTIQVVTDVNEKGRTIQLPVADVYVEIDLRDEEDVLLYVWPEGHLDNDPTARIVLVENLDTAIAHAKKEWSET